MKHLLFILLLPFSLFAQNEVIKIGILPSEYGEGMPPSEFKEFEKNIIKYFDEVKRFDVIKRPEDYLDLQLGWNEETRASQISEEGKKANVPFILQIVFGDTEWTSIGEIPATQIHDAKLWVTINLYNVSTGVLENSITINANSKSFPKFRSAPIAHKRSFKNAVNAGQKSLWKKLKQRLKRLFPFDCQVVRMEESEEKKNTYLSINAGAFHGIQVGDRVNVYYEKEYIIRGVPTMRHIMVGEIKVEASKEFSSICSIKNKKKGKYKIPLSLEEGKVLKCKIIDPSSPTANYGF